jgi:hypothetical protein
VFSTDDSNRNTNEEFVVASVHGTRLRDRGTRVESIQSLVLPRLAAKVSAVQDRTSQMPMSRTLFSEVIAKDRIAVAQQVAGNLAKGKASRSCCPVHSTVG